VGGWIDSIRNDAIEIRQNIDLDKQLQAVPTKGGKAGPEGAGASLLWGAGEVHPPSGSGWPVPLGQAGRV
jgi:hypothetical protein